MRLRLWWLAAPALAGLVFLLDRPRSTTPVHEAEWLPAGDAVLRTVRAGQGDTTLLLLHGFGESLFTWRAVLDPLALHHAVVAVDLPGFGGSSKVNGPYTLAAMTDRLADFVDRWTTGPIVVVGHSMGGELAASLALARPKRIVAAVLIAPAGWAVGLGGIADSMSPGKARAIGWYLSSRAFVLPEHDEAWLGEPDSLAGYTLMGDSAYQHSASRVLEEFDFRALRDRFAEIRVPVLLLWGTLDPVIPFAIADSVLATLSCGTLVTFSGALHRPQVEIPDTVTSTIKAFADDPSCPNTSRHPTSIPQ
ncbi:MAG: alpha/beta fold hydrolase [Gemmatimonadales bacterium]